MVASIMPNLEEKQLVYSAFVLHKRESFDALYLRYASVINKFISYRVSNVVDADDLTANVFWRVWEYGARNKGKEIKNFRALLYKIARNEIANFYRAQGRIPQIVELDDPEEYLEIADAHEDLFKKQLSAEDSEYLIECVQKLPEPYREIIALRYFEELEIKEIADVIEKTLGNTNVLIHRGVKKLQQIMQSQ